MQVSLSLINNINENEIYHYCSTNEGSSGSPILSLETFKVIGIHSGHSPMKFNKGIFIQNAINEFNNQYMQQNHDKSNILKNNINKGIMKKSTFNLQIQINNNISTKEKGNP